MSLLEQFRREGPITARVAMEGVTPASHWILPGSVLVGDAPRPGLTLELLLDYGVSTFVDLRSASASRSYLTQCAIEVPRDVEYHAFDMSKLITEPSTVHITAAARFLAFVLQCALERRRMIYIHDEATGASETAAAVACVIIAFVYQITPLKAATIVSQQYSCRSAPLDLDRSTLFSASLKVLCRDLSAALNTASAALQEPMNTSADPVSAEGSSAPVVEEHPNGQRSSSSSRRPEAMSALALELAPSAAPILGSVSVAKAGDDSVPLSSSQSSRFAHTRGHGGGQAHLNLFTSEHSEPNPTPLRRGRASVPHREDQLRSSHASLGTPDRTATSPSVQSSEAATPTAALAMSQSQRFETPLFTRSVASSLALSAADLPPPLDPKRSPEAARGPIPTSNWVIPGKVCCGSRPIPAQLRTFAPLAAEKFNCFVVLMERNNAVEYVEMYEKLAQMQPGSCAVRFISVADGAMVKGPSVAVFTDVVNEVARCVEAGQWKVYVHCDRGHGRTGLFVTALLWKMYELPPMKALNYCEALHACRVITDEQCSPQTQEQRTGIVSLLQQQCARRDGESSAASTR